MAEEISSNALERGFAILEIVAASNNGLTNSDISRRLQIPKSTASYLLRTLENMSYMTRDADSGRYKLGLRLLGLTRGLLLNLNVRDVAKPHLQKFVDETNMSAHLAVLDSGRAVYVEKVEALSFVKMDIWVGHRVPIHTTAVGKALVAHLPEKEVQQILEQCGMEKRTVQSIATNTKYLRELEKVRNFGFAIDNEENSDGARCVAAPVFNSNGKTIAAFGTSGLASLLTETTLPEIADKIRQAASEISSQMGFQAVAKQAAANGSY